LTNYVFVLATILGVTLAGSSLRAQSSAGENATTEYRYLIDMPAAGVVDRGMVAVNFDFMPQGAVLGKIDVGVFENFCFGVSYGGANVIGSGDVDWYKNPGVNVKLKLLSESLVTPSLSFGFDSQGKGVFFDSTNRYEIKSPGVFIAGSKNFAFLGYMGLHATINYTLEEDDGDNFVNLMLGFEKTIGSQVSFMIDYNFAFNDNSTEYFGKGDGYLNLGVRWNPAPGFTLGFDLRDLLDNRKWSPGAADRALRLEYMRQIL
jgi:hypothetical protein